MQALPDLNSRQLRAVLAVAEYRSFIAAAASLKVSQPALTRTIKQVETALSVELFSRTTRQVTTTPAGKEFVALAERLLNDMKIGIDSLQKHTAHQRGQIIVSSVLSFAEPSFPRLIADYRQNFPGIEIHLREGMHGNVLDDVRGGTSDFGIGYVNSLPDSIAAESLGVETLHVVLPTVHALARHKKIGIGELKEAPLISYPVDSRTRRLVDSAAAAAGFSPRHIMMVNRLSTLMNAVRNGIGIAIVPSSERPQVGDRKLTSRPLAGAQLSRLGILRLRERELNQALSEFLSMTKLWVRQIAPKRLRAAKLKRSHK